MTPDPATPDPATPDPATPDPDPSAHVPAPLVGTADPDLTLTELLAVTPTDEPDMFVGLTETYGQLGIYGGHFLGQALAAAFMTVEEPKLAQSFHAHFLARGNPGAELTYRVDRLRSGHRRDIRAVTALQDGTAVFHLVATFKPAEDGDERGPTAPTVPSVDQVVADRSARGMPSITLPPTVAGRIQMELISEPFMEASPGRQAELQVWARSSGPTTITHRERQVALAYLSDSTIMFTAVLPHGAPFTTHLMTSLDHATWFHHDVDPATWLLFDQSSDVATDGRGLTHGRLFDSAGTLALSCTQEAMIRRI